MHEPWIIINRAWLADMGMWFILGLITLWSFQEVDENGWKEGLLMFLGGLLVLALPYFLFVL